MPIDNSIPIGENHAVYQDSDDYKTAVGYPGQYESVKEDDNGIYGLSQEEYSDADKISVIMPEDGVPVVVLYGPAGCGKTMLLIRMVRYLRDKGYIASPVRTFRPAADANYQQICDGFNDKITGDLAASQTDLISFLLVEIARQGKPICRILEVPGEHILPKAERLRPYPRYLQAVLNSTKLRKIWLAMVEPDWEDQSDRDKYVLKLQDLKRRMSAHDKVIFVFNKVDNTNLVVQAGKVNVAQAEKKTKTLYPGIFNCFENVSPISKMWRKYDCGFVPFQTGTYSEASDGSIYFTPGPVQYCDNLWNTILKFTKG